jgi:uncharacterized membrane protein
MHLLHNPRSAKIRLFIAVALSVIAYFITPNMKSDILRALIAWNVGTWSEIIMTWAIILSSNSRTTKVRAAGNDPGRFFVHVIVLLSAAISLLASIVLMREHEAKAAHQALWWIVCLAGVGGSWVLNHTSWTLRYARMYYRRTRRNGEDRIAGGLVFPGDQEPDDLDFAYFAFTIGSCFQTSDIAITSRSIRRVAIIHAIQSFAYNTTVIAFMLNAIFSLMSG